MKPLFMLLFCLSVGMGQEWDERKSAFREQSERAVSLTERGNLWLADSGSWIFGVIPRTPITLQDWQEYVKSCEPSPGDIEDSLHTLLGRIRVVEMQTYRQEYFTPEEVRDLIGGLRAPMGYKRTPSWEGFAEWLIKRKK